MMRNFVLSLMTVTALAGCSTSSLLKSTEPQTTTYALQPLQASGGEHTGAARVVEISRPTVPPGFQTERIALYLEGGRKLDYYSGAEWPDMLDSVLQEVTRRSLTNALPYAVAMAPAQAIDPDFRLQTKINDFQPVYASDAGDTPVLKVSVEFTLIALPSEKIVSSFTLSDEQSAQSNRLDVIAEGLEKMLQDIEGQAFGKLDAYMRAKLPAKKAQ